MNKKMSNWDLKAKFDSLFDDLFFSNEFKNAMLEKFKIAPTGMTIDTRYDDDVSEIYFKLVSKNYGYEYSGEFVVGDYTLNKFNFNDKMLAFALTYIKEKNPNLWDEIRNSEFYF